MRLPHQWLGRSVDCVSTDPQHAFYLGLSHPVSSYLCLFHLIPASLPLCLYVLPYRAAWTSFSCFSGHRNFLPGPPFHDPDTYKPAHNQGSKYPWSICPPRDQCRSRAIPPAPYGQTNIYRLPYAITAWQLSL